MDDIENAWSSFCNDDFVNINSSIGETSSDLDTATIKFPKSNNTAENESICSSLNISTKTKISYLNYQIPLSDVFWKIPITYYYEPTNGVIKKQMKFNSSTPEEVDEIIKNKQKYTHVDDYIISQVTNTDGRNKFKDIRKISIGICKKDIISYRSKKKSAFYNCFVVILRLLHNDIYKEVHVKVFNTGKLEIPGIQDSTILNKTLQLLVDILTPFIKTEQDKPLAFLDEKTETVMINSNFNCGYYINRESMYKLLKYKYLINSNFDSCSYPGIQCEFYYNDENEFHMQTGTQPLCDKKLKSDKTPYTPTTIKVSFMIFRTGSVLIVGKCSEEILYNIYKFLCNIFIKNKEEIKAYDITQPAGGAGAGAMGEIKREHPRKIRRKTIYVDT
jgi:hypothetical protein